MRPAAPLRRLPLIPLPQRQAPTECVTQVRFQAPWMRAVDWLGALLWPLLRRQPLRPSRVRCAGRLLLRVVFCLIVRKLGPSSQTGRGSSYPEKAEVAPLKRCDAFMWACSFSPFEEAKVASLESCNAFMWACCSSPFEEAEVALPESCNPCEGLRLAARPLPLVCMHLSLQTVECLG